MINDKEYSLTMNHFSQIDLNKQLSDNDSDSDLDYDSDSSDSDSDSDYDSSDYESSDYETDSGSEGSDEDSGSDGSEDSESDESESSSEDEAALMSIDQEDLFNTKTNGNEFYMEVLKNRYLILKKLGYGSFSSVWMAFDVEANVLVALKIINPNDYKEGILEIQTYKKLDNLDNTYLLTMIDCFQVQPIHSKYYTEDYLEKYTKVKNHIVMVLPLMACSAFDLFKCKEYIDGLPIEVCKEIIHQTLLGVKELERNNLMHTDLKPENILICGLNREAEVLLKTILDINIKHVHETQLNKLKKENPNATDDDIWLLSYKLYKEITKTIIKFINNDMNEVKQQMKICKVSSKYLQNIKIKICDFNLVINVDTSLGKNLSIQTRYYRAPEILIGSGLHKKTDYWSIGCILFELLTGEILFDPDKDAKKTRDIHHLYLIEELMGPIPKHMLDNAANYYKLYDKGFLINVGKKIKRWELKDVIKDNYNHLALPDKICTNVVKFINASLNVNPDSRPCIKTMIDNIKNINKN